MTDAELLFFNRRGEALPLYERFSALVRGEYPQTEIRVGKTQISFYDRHMFACVSFLPLKGRAERPAAYITVSFGLDVPLDASRVRAVQARPARWTHHVPIGAAAEVDAELMGWIARSHALACRGGKKKR